MGRVMKIENFKIRVNPEQSRIVQKILFNHKIKWPISSGVARVDKPFLYLENNIIYSGEREEFFIDDPSKELTFNQFMQIYGNRRISKTKQLT